MPTFVHGRQTKVYIGGYNASTTLRSTTYSGSNEPADVTCFGASDKAYIPGLNATEAAAEGVLSSGTAEADEMLAAVFSGTAQPWTILLDGDTFGNAGWAHPALVSGFEITAENGDAVRFNVSATGTDYAVDRVVSIRAAASSSATAAGTNHDGGAGGSNRGWAAYLHVISGTVSAGTVIVEHSVDGATSWATLATFPIAGTAAVGGLGGAYTEGSGTVRRYVRHNLTAITGTATFAVAFARR